MKHQIFIPCVPPKATHQGSAMILRRKDGTPFVGKASNSAGAKAKKTLLTLLLCHAPKHSFEGPTEVEVKLVFPWRKSEPKKNKALGIMPMVTKPDLDNLSKMIVDSMADANWFAGGDQQVHLLTLSKWWGDEVGITITTKGNNGTE